MANRSSLPLEPPRDLTLPDPGSNTARGVLSRAVGRLLSEIRPLLRAHARSAPEDVAAIDRLLERSLRENVGPLASVLRRPHAGALVRALRTTPPGRAAPLVTELCATLAADLATLGALPGPIRLRRVPARVVSLVARAALFFDAGAHDVDFANGDAIEGARREDPYRAIDADLVLALVDNNPLAMMEAHPDKHGNAIDLGGRAEAEWIDSLRAVRALLARHLPELHEESKLFVQQIVPVGFDAGQHLSASYREAVGTVYLSLHPNPMTMAEAFVHELSHNKLNALLDLDEVLTNAFEPLYASPVRPDPRPLHGVLLAVHAFLPVARLYERMIEARDPLSLSPGFEARWRDVVRIDREGAALLREHARPTPVGQGLLDEIVRWDAYFGERVGRRA